MEVQIYNRTRKLMIRLWKNNVSDDLTIVDDWKGPPPTSPPCDPPYPFFRLELLANVDHLFVDQKVELLEG